MGRDEGRKIPGESRDDKGRGLAVLFGSEVGARDGGRAEVGAGLLVAVIVVVLAGEVDKFSIG